MIFVQENESSADIGRVYVSDKDDWDVNDKTFKWKDSNPHPHFALNSETGMITMDKDVPEGKYFLSFQVDDPTFNQENIPANVTVTVKNISHSDVLNAGSVRIAGLSAKDFIQSWYGKSSKADLFQEKLAQILEVNYEDVEVFSVMDDSDSDATINIWFSVKGTQVHQVKLNAALSQHKEEVQEYVGVDITMVNINECLDEGQCEGSCTNLVTISDLPNTVDSNQTSLVGVMVQTVPSCTCRVLDYGEEEM